MKCILIVTALLILYLVERKKKPRLREVDYCQRFRENVDKLDAEISALGVKVDSIEENITI